MSTETLDYAGIMAEIAGLMARNPEPGTPEGDRLRELGEAARAYERARHPLPPVDPITAIRFRMEQAGLGPRDLVPYLGSRSRVSEVLSGKRPLTLAMIRSLHRGLGIPAESLIAEPMPTAGVGEIDWDRFPIAEMRKRGWLPAWVLTAQDAHAAIQEMIAPVLTGGMGAVLFRGPDPTANPLQAHVRSAQAPDWYALVSWTARVVARAKENPPASAYRPASLTEEFLRRVARTSWSAQGPNLAAELLTSSGIAFVVEPALPGLRLDGAAIWLQESPPVIAMTLRFDRLDSFWFTLLHELAHLARHLSPKLRACYDDLEADDKAQIEKEADLVAGEALIPSDARELSTVLANPSPFLVNDLARGLGIHPAIVAGRVRNERGNYRLLAKHVGQGEVRRLFSDIRW